MQFEESSAKGYSEWVERFRRFARGAEGGGSRAGAGAQVVAMPCAGRREERDASGWLKIWILDEGFCC